jgi:hypothetical protein
MGGAYVMILGMDIAGTAVSDLQDCGRVVRFFESTNFNEMAPHDELVHGGTQYVLADPGNSYIAYASALSGDIGLTSMTAGTYNFRWFDCATGTSVTQAGVIVGAGSQTWNKPVGIGNELAVHIQRIQTSEILRWKDYESRQRLPQSYWRFAGGATSRREPGVGFTE